MSQDVARFSKYSMCALKYSILLSLGETFYSIVYSKCIFYYRWVKCSVHLLKTANRLNLMFLLVFCLSVVLVT